MRERGESLFSNGRKVHQRRSRRIQSGNISFHQECAYTDTYNELRGAARCLASRQGLATDETTVVGIVGNYGLIRSGRESKLNSISGNMV